MRRARSGDGYWCNSCYEWSRRHGWADPATRERHQTADPDRGCSVGGCREPHKALGYCQGHYTQHRAHGDPTVRVRRPYGTLREELEAAATATTDGCIYLDRQSERPRVNLDGTTMQASRAVWVIAHGDPGAAHVLHTCNGGSGEDGCINVRHLRLGDHAENMADMTAAGRSQRERTDTRGEDNGNAILTDEAVREIRSRYRPGRPFHPGNRAALAEEFGVSEATVKDVVTGRRWRHVE